MKTHSILLLFGVVAMVSLLNARTNDMEAESLNDNKDDSADEDYLLFSDRDEQTEGELTDQSQTGLWPTSDEEADGELDDARCNWKKIVNKWARHLRSRCDRRCRRRFRDSSDEQAEDEHVLDEHDQSHVAKRNVLRRFCYGRCNRAYPIRGE